MKNISACLEDLFLLFIPHTCAGCGSDQLSRPHFICFQCASNLPHTQFTPLPNNPIEHLFRGRLHLQHATSTFYFGQQSITRALVHRVKYDHQQALGLYLGRLMGQQLSSAARFSNIDTIVPLPLSRGKLRQRGFNQSHLLARGINELTNWPINYQTALRNHYDGSQTTLSRAERWENVTNSFIIREPALLQNKHVLLVDDVLTTGATLEACGQVLLSIPGLHLSIATFACAIH